MKDDLNTEKAVQLLSTVTKKCLCEPIVQVFPLVCYSITGKPSQAGSSIELSPEELIILQSLGWWQQNPLSLEVAYSFFANFSQTAGGLLVDTNDSYGQSYFDLMLMAAVKGGIQGFKNKNEWEIIGSIKILIAILENLPGKIDHQLLKLVEAIKYLV